MNESFAPGYSIKRVCAWCGELMGLIACGPEQHGQINHGICPVCAHIFSGIDQLEDRQAHKCEPHLPPVAGSTPAPATILSPADLAIANAEFLLTQSTRAARRRAPLTQLMELLGRLRCAERQLSEFLR